MSDRGAASPSSGSDGDAQPGLQAERTAMAWQRTGLGVGAFGLLLLHRGAGGAALLAVGAAGLLAALALLFLAERRYVMTVRQVADGLSPTARGAIRLVAVSVAGLAVAAAVVLSLA